MATHPATYFPVKAKSVGNATLRRAALELIGHGIGCDAFGDHEPENEAYTAAVDLLSLARDEQIGAAKQVWGIE